MALILHNPGVNPLGQFDCLDTQLAGFLGGEIVTFAQIAINGGDLAAQDVFQDGYLPGSTTPQRVVLQRASTSTSLPTLLADDGTVHYGTLLGVVVGATVGKQVVNGAVLGPSSATGSGKLTAWDKPGLFGVTLDAVDTTATTGLVITNPTLTAGGAGSTLSFTSTGLLTPHASGLSVGPIVGRFASFETSGSLVTTPASLTSALNSPSGNVSSVQALSLYQAVFYFYGAAPASA